MPHSVLVDQAAALLGVSRRTVYYRIRQGKLLTLRTRCGSQRVLMSSIERLNRESGRDLDTAAPSPPERRLRAGPSPEAPVCLDDLTMVQDAGV